MSHEVIIGRLVSLFGQRLRATIVALWVVAIAGSPVVVAAQPDSTWVALSPLPNQPRSALFALAVDPFSNQLVIAGDARGSLFRTTNGGASWKSVHSGKSTSSTIAVRLASGPLPPTGNVRPLLLGTNTGLFHSRDNGATFTPLSGGGLLPTTDYTQTVFITVHYDRFYVASDGGGSGSGGLWRTKKSGQKFTTLRPPEASINPLAGSHDEKTSPYAATFLPSSHTPALWAHADIGGAPPRRP